MRLDSRWVASRTGLLTIVATVGALVATCPAQALTVVGFQYIFGFDDPTEPFGVPASTGLQTDFSCSCVVGPTLDARFPPRSGSGLVTATDFQIIVEDPFNISWPAFGAYVTGYTDVVARFYAYNYDTQTQDLVATLHSGGPNYIGSGGEPNQFMQFIEPGILTLADFSSSQPFTLDDVTVGLPDVPPGIPEPATWAMMLVGFSLLGVALRRQSALAGTA